MIAWAVGFSNNATHLAGPNAIFVDWLSLLLLLSNLAAAIDIVRRWIKELSVVMLALNYRIRTLLVRRFGGLGCDFDGTIKLL